MILQDEWGVSQRSGRDGQREVRGGRRRRAEAASPGGAAQLSVPRVRFFLAVCF